MKVIDWESVAPEARATLLQRPSAVLAEEVRAAAARVIAQVRADGDIALRALTRRFDGVELGAFEVTAEEFAAAEAAVSPALRAALAEARDRIRAYHAAGATTPFEMDAGPGVVTGRLVRPIRRVGLYVPAGSAPLPSTALMLATPAVLAGCREIVLCTPPRPDGSADPAVLVAARLCGERIRVFKLGGAQAIAAMAAGTESVPRCDKLFGPGNQYVTAAKQLVSQGADGPAIDMPAGPSEVLVIADAGADPELVAADLLSQAEHGPDSQVLALSDDAALLREVAAAVERQVGRLPRGDIARKALANSRLIALASLDDAFALSNDYGPEHLILQLRDARAWLDRVEVAGSVFLGDWAPEGLGDYCSGPNHVLPTGGAARAYSGVSLLSFQTTISLQEVTPEGLRAIGPCAAEIARAEGLVAHERSVTLRLAKAEAQA